MCKYKSKAIFVSFIVIFLVWTWAGGRAASLKGTIAGYVKDAKTGEPLPGANILIKGTSMGTASDNEGYYFIKLVPGNYTLIARYIGYKTREFKIKVFPSRTTKQDLILEHITLKGKAVEVTAQAAGQMEAINKQLSSRTIKNVVSSDRIQEIPEANAAEAIGRLPGVSVLRSGGEGYGVVIRGLSPKYNAVMVNGVLLPSTGRADRSTSLSGISQYMLGGVELTKALTSDMEANSLGGAVDLKIKEAPAGFHLDILAQPGYNHQNNYYKNYKYVGNISNRFLNDRIGVIANVTLERVNRSTQQLAANYQVETAKYEGKRFEKLFFTSANLSDITNIKRRGGASFMFDYRLPNGKLTFFNFFNRSVMDNYTNVTKTYDAKGNTVSYNIYNSPKARSDIMTSALQGDNQFRWFELNYGISDAQTDRKEPNGRMWNFWMNQAFPTYVSSQLFRLKDPQDIIPLANDKYTVENMKNMIFGGIFLWPKKMKDQNLSGYANFKMPFKLGQKITGNIKFGGKYRYKTRSQDENRSMQSVASNPPMKRWMVKKWNWIVRQQTGGEPAITAINFRDYDIHNFLHGKYDFGWYPDISKLNEITDAWTALSDSILALPDSVWRSKYGELYKIGYVKNYRESVQFDQNIVERYSAGYVMAEINIGSKLMIMPGIRYEKMRTRYTGWQVQKVANETQVIPGKDTTAYRDNEYWFPMIQVRYKPTKWFDIRFARTRSISRPGYLAATPFRFIDTYNTTFESKGNYKLKPSLSTNYDLQFSFYGNTIGLFTVDGFYKVIQDLIWPKTWKRLLSDPVEYGFSAKDTPYIQSWVNNPHKAYVRGMEFEWQTHFWYLPSPLKNLVLSANYSHIYSRTDYPRTIVRTALTDSIKRGPIWIPIYSPVRIDTVQTAPLLHQPDNTANISLGYDFRGFSARFSWVYYGKILDSKSTRPEQDGFKNKFYRLDLQVRQKLPIKGLELMMDGNNLNDIQEQSKYRGSIFPTRLENYGWTADIGLRYRF